MNKVAKAANDGYTLLFTHMGTLAVNIALYKSLPYDSQKDFEPIGLGGTNPMVLVTKKDLPAKTFAEFQAYVKANQKKVQYGMAGIGAASHLGGLMLNSMMKVDVLEIPYKGTGPALNDLVSGQFDYMVDQAVNVLAQINSGNIKALGVSTLKRLPQLPDVPTIDEAGLKGYEVTIWNGFFGPKGMSKDNIAKINDALVKTMADPAIVKRLTELAVDLPSKEEASPTHCAHSSRRRSTSGCRRCRPRREAGIGFNRAFCRRDGELGHRARVLRPPASCSSGSRRLFAQDQLVHPDWAITWQAAVHRSDSLSAKCRLRRAAPA